MRERAERARERTQTGSPLIDRDFEAASNWRGALARLVRDTLRLSGLVGLPNPFSAIARQIFTTVRSRFSSGSRDHRKRSG